MTARYGVRFLVAASAAALLAGCGVDIEKCVDLDLAAVCPPTTSPDVSAAAETACRGAVKGRYEPVGGGVGGEVSALCTAQGFCKIRCQLDHPCRDGLARATRDEVVCNTPPACGNGQCEAGESPADCPRDCTPECTPGDELCDGSQRRVCEANSTWRTLSCGAGAECRGTAAGKTECVAACDSMLCSGHGSCASGTCTCNTGYAGPRCDTCAPGYSGYPQCARNCAAKACNGHGSCADDVCTCDPRYAGPTCDRCAPSYTSYPQCAAACVLPWGGTVAHGETVTAYASSSVGCGESCRSRQRLCQDGVLLDPDFGNQSCQVSASCDCPLPWGGRLSHGQSVTAYAVAAPACGTACAAQTRTCSNGRLDGSFEYPSCTEPSCGCALPWGGTLADGDVVTVYESSSVGCGSTCRSESLRCTGRTLSGSSFTARTCSATACRSCTAPWSATVPHDQSVTAFASACASSCSSQVRTCDDGSLTGSYREQSCQTVTDYWTRVSGGTVDVVDSASGQFQLTIEFGTGASGQARFRVCKPPGETFNDDVHVRLRNGLTPHTNLMLFDAVLVADTRNCSEYGDLSASALRAFESGDAIGGNIRIVSPNTCNARWGASEFCTSPPNPGCGTCFGRVTGPMLRRTCRP